SLSSLIPPCFPLSRSLSLSLSLSLSPSLSVWIAHTGLSLKVNMNMRRHLPCDLVLKCNGILVCLETLFWDDSHVKLNSKNKNYHILNSPKAPSLSHTHTHTQIERVSLN